MSKKNLKNSFCILPFTSVDVRNNTVLGPCCYSKLTNNYEEISDYWNSDELKSLRKDLLNGVQNTICSHCWRTESYGLTSLRQSVNRRFRREFLQNPRIVELKYKPGKECNLACMMCSEDFSSKFSSLWKGEMIPPSTFPNSEVADVDNHKKVSKWIYENYHYLESLTVSGGEPLYNKNFLKMMDFLIEENASKDIILYINTNATILSEPLIEKLKQFKNVVLMVSIEAIGSVNNYIRWYSNFDIIDKNMKMLNENFEISIQPTISALNIIHLPKLEKFCLERGYNFGNDNIVGMWDELAPKNLPTKLKSLVDKKYYNLISEEGKPEQLIEFIKKWDQKRNVRIEDYMPEWKGIINYN